MAKYMTKQRKILQEYLSNHIDEELSAKKVAEELSDQNISLSAVYRNLADMEKEKEVVQCTKEGSREFFFRYIKSDVCSITFHISCKVCNKVEHLPIDETNFVKDRIKNKLNYDLDLANTVFYGICSTCQAI